ncbi:MAG: LacI family DNA-binding transcriptional regulator [Spirochaetaceae bacterium]|nr:MAG: LacI family DNA-binding transcriptional regulator [Spirochaetaceae bacterium]
MSSYKMIAEHAGVSIGTVYRVTHERGRVADATRERVKRAIAELGYERNIYASNLSRQKTYRFGLLMPRTHLNSGYWQFPYAGAMAAGAELQKYRVAIEPFLYDENSLRSFEYYARSAREAELDGLLVAAVTAVMDGNVIDRLPEVPRVHFDSYVEDPRAIGYVGQDSHASGRLAAHLMAVACSLPCRVIAIRAFHGEPASTSWTHHIEERVQGFSEYATERDGFQVIEVAVDTVSGLKGFQAAIETGLAENSAVDGIFVSNSETHLAVDAVRSIPELHGKHVRIVGYDLVDRNTRLLKDGSIDFLLCQRPYEQGYRGVHLLHRSVVLKEEVGGRETLPTDIVTQENLPEA